MGICHKSTMNSSPDKVEFESTNRPCKGRPSISSNSDSNSDSDSDNDSTGLYARIHRSKVDDSIISKSSVKRSKVKGSMVSGVRSAKWTKIKSSAVTNVRSMKACEIEAARIQDVDYIKRAAIERSDVADCGKIKRSKVRDSLLKRVVLGRSRLEKCEVVDCVIHGSNFTGMRLENGIWKNGALVGRVDETKEVVVRAIDEVRVSSPSPNSFRPVTR